eukprot:2927665-Lingulodinium_polyedra.AAC.1
MCPPQLVTFGAEFLVDDFKMRLLRGALAGGPAPELPIAEASGDPGDRRNQPLFSRPAAAAKATAASPRGPKRDPPTARRPSMHAAAGSKA